jgi:hypothetical protein
MEKGSRYSNSTFWLPFIALIGVLIFFAVLICPIFVFPDIEALAQDTPKIYSQVLRDNTGMIVTPTPTATPLPVPDSVKVATGIAPFVGTWYKHSGIMTITADGHAHVDLRVYQDCSETNGKPPCDSVKNGQILDGLQEDIIITMVRNGTAYGTITKSTVEPVGTKVSIIFGENYALTYRGNIFCGPKSPFGWCG